MTTVIIVIAWWACGAAVLLWLQERPITWAQLLFSVMAGFFGPLIPLAIGVAILLHADFWHKPVFKSHKQGGQE